MAVLKYKNGEGQFVTLTNYTVRPITPVQTQGSSMSDVMSQKAVTDGLAGKVNNSDLNAKIATAVTVSPVKDAIDAEISDAISSNVTVQNAISEALENGAAKDAVDAAIDSKLENYSDKDEMTAAINAATAQTVNKTDFNNYKNLISDNFDAVARAVDGKADKNHVHAISDVSGLTDALASKADKTYVDSNFVSAATYNAEKQNFITNNNIDEKVADALANDSTVSEAVEGIINQYITEDGSSLKAALEAKADKADTLAEYGITDAYTKSEVYTKGEADDKFQAKGNYAAENHNHEASSLTGFDTAVVNTVNNNSQLISGTIDNIIEKYIYGDSTPTAGSEVVTTDNLEATLADYAKTEAIPTKVSQLENDGVYVKTTQIDGMVANAITNDETVKHAVNDAIASAITDADVVKEAISGATNSFFNDVVYTKTPVEGTSGYTYKIDFLNSGTLKKSINVDDFVIDGMVNNVEIKTIQSGEPATNVAVLEVTFNDGTQIGKVIDVPITSIFNPDNYYDKTATDNTFLKKSDASATYATKSEVEINYVKSNDLDDKIAAAVSGSAVVSDSVEEVINNYLTDDNGALKQALDGKADKEHAHAASDITDFSDAVANAINDTQVVETISGTIESIIKEYIYGDVTPGADAEVITTENIAEKGAEVFASKEHTHAISDITNLEESLAGKAAIDHTHAMSAITGLNTEFEKYVKTETLDGVVSGFVTSAQVETIVTDYTESPDSDVITNDKIEIILSDYYTKQETTDKINSAITEAGGVTTEIVSDMINQAVSGKADTASTYTKTQVNNLLIEKANTDSVYTKTDVDSALSNKASVNHTHVISGVTGLQTALDNKAALNHEHTASQITDLSGSVVTIVNETVGTNPTAITNIVSAVTASTEFVTISGTANSALETANSANSAATAAQSTANAAKAVTDFYVDHNSVSSLANIPTTKRLVIATISTSTNELSINNNSLADGYEIHIIIKNEGSENATVTVPTSGNYYKVGSDITIEAGAYGEVNVISDGTNLYVRGA